MVNGTENLCQLFHYVYVDDGGVKYDSLPSIFTSREVHNILTFTNRTIGSAAFGGS